MPKIEKREREVKPQKAEDVIVKVGKYRFYFQNYYTIISLANDLLTGGLYFVGSLSNLLGGPPIVGQILYILGGFFLLMRPILKILRNIFFYNEQQYQEEIVKPTEENEEEDKDYNEDYYGD